MRVVLALDPGSTDTAYSILQENGTNVYDILGSGKVSNNLLLSALRGVDVDFNGDDQKTIGETPSDIDPVSTILAVEMIASYGMPVGRDVFETCVWIGRFIEVFEGPYTLVYRIDVKRELCRNAGASDPAVSKALTDRYGPKGTKKNPGPLYGFAYDMYSALAVGTTFLDHSYLAETGRDERVRPVRELMADDPLELAEYNAKREEKAAKRKKKAAKKKAARKITPPGGK